jgi:uncharacterized protein
MSKKPLIAAPPPATGHEVDLFRFAAEGAHTQGTCAVAALPRLAAESLNLDAQIQWTAQGVRRAVPHQLDATGAPVLRDFLLLTARAQLTKNCDRCGQPVQLALDIAPRLEVFLTEAQADEAPLEDESADPIVGSKKFSLLQQVEEELLLAIPPYVTHLDCNVAQDDASATKPSPFSKLAALQIGQKSKK